MTKNKTDFSWYTHDDLLNLAYDRAVVAKMDKEASAALVYELGVRLQRATDELYRAQR
jgi:hypothetical protein